MSKIDEGLGQNTSLNNSNLLSANPSQNDLLRSNFQNMPIFETSEDQETTKRYMNSITVDMGDEYEGFPPTSRLSVQEKAFFNNKSKNDSVLCKLPHID
jgi:hypothetical protein